MASRKKGGVAATVSALAAPLLEQLGLTQWDLEFVKEGADWFLRFYIDKEGGVTIDDCEAFSRLIDKRLDEADPIEQSYCLEVSSPGIERRLRADWHFSAMAGRRVKVRLIRPLDGRRDFEGILLGVDGDTVRIETEGAVTGVKKADAAWFRLCDDQDFSGGTIK